MEIRDQQIRDLESHVDEAERLLKALANRHRLLVLCELHGGEKSVGELQEAVGLSQSALSQHLAWLREDGIVSTRREAQTIHYALNSPEVKRLIAVLHDMYCTGGCGT
jgi:DNA-binding transcriptional ArsR family regulator